MRSCSVKTDSNAPETVAVDDLNIEVVETPYQDYTDKELALEKRLNEEWSISKLYFDLFKQILVDEYNK